MNLYLDTSALVKLYVKEPGATAVRVALRQAELIATSPVAYPEARAALARRHREGGLSARALRGAVADLDRDWNAYVLVTLNRRVAQSAGDLAERHALRGFDAVHLASAMELERLVNASPDFCCYDQNLAKAASAEGLGVKP
jgi:predicted nucleic acid-binding protein